MAGRELIPVTVGARREEPLKHAVTGREEGQEKEECLREKERREGERSERAEGG